MYICRDEISHAPFGRALFTKEGNYHSLALILNKKKSEANEDSLFVKEGATKGSMGDFTYLFIQIRRRIKNLNII